MYFNWRLWGFTKPFRRRIWAAVVLGVFASALGIARLALIGWLLAQVFAGAPLAGSLRPPHRRDDRSAGCPGIRPRHGRP
jgi:ATP-binding cassette subfamily C protein CydCD